MSKISSDLNSSLTLVIPLWDLVVVEVFFDDLVLVHDAGNLGVELIVGCIIPDMRLIRNDNRLHVG